MNDKKFTIFELFFALILVVAIGLLIIPSVNIIFLVARSKTYEEMVNNIVSKTSTKYKDEYADNTYDCVIFNINKDLGFEDIGTYTGYTIVKDNTIYMSIYNRFLILQNVPFTKKEDILPYSKKFNHETFDLNSLINELNCKDYIRVSE